MAGTTTAFDNLDMGPCNVSFKETDLGLTKGGVSVEIATDVTEVTADQFGDTVINEYIKGRKVTVKVPLAENDLTKLTAVTPGATLVGTTTKKMVVNSATGLSLRSLAGALILHPKNRDTADKSRDLVVPLAIAKGDISFSYKHDDQKVFEVTFTGYVNLDTDELVTFGDPAAAA